MLQLKKKAPFVNQRKNERVNSYRPSKHIRADLDISIEMDISTEIWYRNLSKFFNFNSREKL